MFQLIVQTMSLVVQTRADNERLMRELRETLAHLARTQVHIQEVTAWLVDLDDGSAR
jgi:hypothetical protein